MPDKHEKSGERLQRFIGLPKKVTALLEKESDRGAILILAAYVEEFLGLILSESCSSEALGEEILQYRNPGGDFSSKILLCEAFGLISPDEAKASHCLRRIRNNAAHFDQAGRGFDVLFDSPKTLQQAKAFLKHLNLTLTTDSSQAIRETFVAAGRLLTSKLSLRVFEAHRARIPKTLKETANLARAKMKDTDAGKAIEAAEREAREGKPEKLFALLQATLQATSHALVHGTGRTSTASHGRGQSKEAEQDRSSDTR